MVPLTPCRETKNTATRRKVQRFRLRPVCVARSVCVASVSRDSVCVRSALRPGALQNSKREAPRHAALAADFRLVNAGSTLLRREIAAMSSATCDAASTMSNSVRLPTSAFAARGRRIERIIPRPVARVVAAQTDIRIVWLTSIVRIDWSSHRRPHAFAAQQSLDRPERRGSLKDEAKTSEHLRSRPGDSWVTPWRFGANAL